MRGSTGAGPLKTLDSKSLEEGGKRFRFVPLHTRLLRASARPSALPSIDFISNIQDVKDDDTSFSHFSATLDQKSETNLTAIFTGFVERVRPLSLSLPLVFRNRARLVNLTLAALSESMENGAIATLPITQCITALCKDVGPEHFHPFFPQIVKSFAEALNPKSRTSELPVDKKPTHSLYWDPENSMIPIFASLSEITKILLKPLAANPKVTIRAALPLLSSSHYRVREMTAESCLGYLIRKTRNEQVIQQTVHFILYLCTDADVDVTSWDAAVDGLGVTLFEAARLPSGHLHSRGPQLLAFLQASLAKYTNEQKSKTNVLDDISSRMCGIVTRCYAGLSSHINDGNDLQSVFDSLLVSLRHAMKQENGVLAGYNAFLIRKSLVRGLSSLLSHDSLYIQKIMNSLHEVWPKFKDSPRLTYEALGAFAHIATSTADVKLRYSALKSLSACLILASESSNAKSLTSAMAVALSSERKLQDVTSTAGIRRGYASLCEQMATIVEKSDPCSSNSHSGSGLKAVLKMALAWLSIAKAQSGNKSSESFDLAPIKSYLASTMLKATNSQVKLCEISSLRDEILYLSYIPLTDMAESLGTLLTGNVQSNVEFGQLLVALSFQVAIGGETKFSSMREIASVIQKRLVQQDFSPFTVSDFVEGVQKFISTAPDAGLQHLSSNANITRKCITSLHKNLSSQDPALREKSLILLSTISRWDAQQGADSHTDAQQGEKSSLQFNLAELRNSIPKAANNLVGLYNVLHFVTTSGTTLAQIDIVLRVLQELARLLRSIDQVNPSAVEASIYFSIGLLNTPLKSLWSAAGDIWCAATSLTTDHGISVAVEQLEEAGTAVLGERMKLNPENLIIDEDVSMRDAIDQSRTEEQRKSTSVNKKRPRPTDDPHQATSHPNKQAKRQRLRKADFLARSWSDDEWKRFATEDLNKAVTGLRSIRTATDFRKRIMTDRLTFLQQLLITLSKEPKHTLKHRSRIIRVYLSLETNLFSKRIRNDLLMWFARLLEKMGGLKCCENDKKLEQDMRNRLLSDLAATGGSAQQAVFLCLCTSRSPSLQPHWESYLKLIDEKTFREQLAILSESLTFGEKEASLTSQDDIVRGLPLDVLVNICFSKMMGTLANKGSRRGAILSFISSKLPGNTALPRMTDLILSPLHDLVQSPEKIIDLGQSVHTNYTYPPVGVQLGIITSIEALLKICKRSLPSDSWSRVAAGLFVLLRNAGRGSAGQSVRSRVLKVVGNMCTIRPEETEIFAHPIVQLMKHVHTDSSGRSDGQGTPALLQFLAQIFDSELIKAQEMIICKEKWILEWAFRFLDTESKNPATIIMALGISDCVMSIQLDDTTALLNVQSLTVSVTSALRGLLNRLVEDIIVDRSKQKTWTTVFDTALKVTEKLAKINSIEPDTLNSLGKGLTSYLTNNKVSPTSGLIAIKGLRAIVTAMQEGIKKGHSPHDIDQMRATTLVLVSLLSDRRFIRDTELYKELCKLFGSLGLADLSLSSSLLESMSAMDESRLDHPDLDQRVEALNRVIRTFKEAIGDSTKYGDKRLKYAQICPDQDTMPVTLGKDSVLMLLHGCTAGVRYNDPAVRGTSGYALKLISRWVGLSGSEATKAIRMDLFNLLVESVTSSRVGDERIEYSRALGEFIRTCGSKNDGAECFENDLFSILKTLTNGLDNDSDFFENIVHMQAHRRGRALRQLSSVLRGGSLSDEAYPSMKSKRTELASRFAFPLGLNIALESSTVERGNNPRSRHNESRENARKDVIVWALALVAESSFWLSWGEYKSRILGLLRKMNKEENEREMDLLCKAVAKVAEGFPLLENDTISSQDEKEAFLVDVLLPKMLFGLKSSAGARDTVSISKRSLGGKPPVHTTINPSAFRAPIAVAAGNLLCRLSDSNISNLISLLICPIANALRSRVSSVQESAKKALIIVSIKLGSKYFRYIVKQVFAALDRGARKDVCVHVLQALLIGIKDHNMKVTDDDQIQHFFIDGASEDIATYLALELERSTASLLNDFQDPNASSVFLKKASTTNTKTLECEELLAEQVRFDDSARRILRPLFIVLDKSSSRKLSSKVENALQKISVGFSRNESMCLKSVFDLCLEMIHSSMAESLESNAKSLCGSEDVPEEKEICWLQDLRMDYRVARFGFLLLGSVVNKNAASLMDTTQEAKELCSMLEPILAKGTLGVQSKHDALKLTALRTMNKLLKFPLKRKRLFTSEITTAILDVLQQTGGVHTHEDELFNSCLQAAGVVLQDVGGQSFSKVPRERVEALISIASSCIESGSVGARTSALGLLRGLISGKLMIPALYDAMEIVGKMAIRAQSSNVRSTCTSLCIKFMVSFPLGSKRVRQHLEFFVRNLSYDLGNGRLAALEALKTIIQKFPAEILEQECEYIFLALAASVAKDSDGSCRELGSKVLQGLFERVPAGKKIRDMLKMASGLLGLELLTKDGEELVENLEPRDPEIQLSGAYALTAGCRSGRLSQTQQLFAARVFLAALQNLQSNSPWELYYALLQGVEALLDDQGSTDFDWSCKIHEALGSLWKNTPELLLHEHQWVRLSSSRLLGKHLSASGGRDAKETNKDRYSFSVLWRRDGLVRALMQSLCLQLEANEVSEELAQQCLKNLLCLGTVVFHHRNIGNLGAVEHSVQDRNAVEESENMDTDLEMENRGVYWLLHRISGLSTRSGEDAHDLLRRGCAVRFLLVTVKWWGIEFVKKFKKAYIAPVFKLLGTGSSGTQSKVEGARRDGLDLEGLRDLAKQLQEALVESIGANEYYEVYQELQSGRERVKRARKRQEALDLAINPERAAKRRRKRTEKKRRKKLDKVRSTGY